MRYPGDIDRARMRLVPTVVEETRRGERGWDIYSRLLRDRIVFVGSEIDDEVANLLIAQLLFLDSEDPAKDAKHTGQSVDTIRRDTERDRFMTAEEAKEYGLIDEIFAR